MPSITGAVLRRFKRELPPLGVRGMEGMHDLAIADHTTTWMAEVATELLTLAAHDAALRPQLGDGEKIHTLLADLHGRQRARFDWTERALEHEYTILLEELLREAPSDAHGEASPVVSDLRRITADSRVRALSALQGPGRG